MERAPNSSDQRAFDDMHQGAMQIDDEGACDSQTVEQSLNCLLSETDYDDQEMDQRMKAVERELAESEKFRVAQHAELVLLREELARVEFENIQGKAWNENMLRQIREKKSKFGELNQRYENLAISQSRYNEQRDELQGNARKACLLVEAARNGIDALKAKNDRELQRLRQQLKEEQALTDALLTEIFDDEEIRRLEEEDKTLDNELLDLDTKMKIEELRRREIQEQILQVKLELEEEEEICRQNDKIEEEIAIGQRNIQEKNALLKEEQKKKEELEAKSKAQKERLQSAMKQHEALKRKNEELKEKEEVSDSDTRKKELQQGIKDLLVSRQNFSAERSKMVARKTDLEKQINEKQNTIADLSKRKENVEKRNYLLEQEIHAIEQDTLGKKVEIGIQKYQLGKLEHLRYIADNDLENLRKQVEERDNMCSKDNLQYKDEIECEVVKIEQLDLLLQKHDELLADCQSEKNILLEELEMLFDKVKSLRNCHEKQPISNRDPIQLEEMKDSIQKQIDIVSTECSKTEKKNEHLKVLIEEQKKALETCDAEIKFSDERSKELESEKQLFEENLLAAQERNKETEKAILSEEEKITSLENMKKKLELEVESYPSDSVNDELIASYEKQIEDIDSDIKRMRSECDSKDDTYNEEIKKLEVLLKSKLESEEALQNEIRDLKKRLADSEEENKKSDEQLSEWRKKLDDNEEKANEKEKRRDEIKTNAEVIKNEVAELTEQLAKRKTDLVEEDDKYKAEIQEILKEIDDLKKRTLEKQEQLNEEETKLKEKIKVAQKELKHLLSDGANPDSVQSCETPMKPPAAKPRMTLNQISSQAKEHPEREPSLQLTQRAPAVDSPSSDSTSSIEITKEDFQNIRAGKTTIFQIASSQNKLKSPKWRNSRSQ